MGENLTSLISIGSGTSSALCHSYDRGAAGYDSEFGAFQRVNRRLYTIDR